MYRDILGKFEQADKEDPSTKEPDKPESITMMTTRYLMRRKIQARLSFRKRSEKNRTSFLSPN